MSGRGRHRHASTSSAAARPAASSASVAGRRRAADCWSSGVVRGETITLLRAAPLGDPLEFVVKGYHLSLRRREAATITVEALAARGDAGSRR